MRSCLQGTWREGDQQPDVAALDTYFQRYGWDWETYLNQPEWLIQELGALIAGEADYHREEAVKAEAERQRQARGHEAHGPVRHAPPPTPPEQVLQAAWDSGMPMPGGRDPLLGA